MGPRIGSVTIAPKNQCVLLYLFKVLRSRPGLHRIKPGMHCGQPGLSGDCGAVFISICRFEMQKPGCCDPACGCRGPVFLGSSFAFFNRFETPGQYTDRACCIEHQAVDLCTVSKGDFLSDHSSHGMTKEVISLNAEATKMLDYPISVSTNAGNRRMMGVFSETRQINSNYVKFRPKGFDTPIPLRASAHETMNQHEMFHVRWP